MAHHQGDSNQMRVGGLVVLFSSLAPLIYMKLLPKIHKLDKPASQNNITKLTGRPIITTHSWTTSNPLRLLGTKLDNIILRLKTERPF